MKPIPDSARIDEVRRLKQEGLSMTQIIDRLNGGGAPPHRDPHRPKPFPFPSPRHCT
jgi:hypothetical protein